jgi:uncharacterized protein YqeY
MSLRETLNAAMKDAMRSKDTATLSTIRLINAAIKDRDINARPNGNGEGISENDILSLLQTMIKQRTESIKTYEQGNRPDLAEREAAEITIIRTFLPKEMDEAELATLVNSIVERLQIESIRDMSKVMDVLKNDYAGQINMGIASKIIKDRLAA